MKNLKGVFTALVSPLKNGQLDLASLERLARHQLASGIDGFVVNGTTGESPTIKFEESEKVFQLLRKLDPTKVLIYGTGSNNTEKTISDSQRAEALGADALLVVVPYYNKPPQRGLVEHFKAVAEKVKTPILLYNVPGRTITGLSIESIAELSKVPNIVGIKEATGDIGFFKEIKGRVRPGFIFLSGDDGTYMEFLKEGGHGVISVTSHLFPAEMKRWTTQALEGKHQENAKEFERYKKLTDLCFCEANPIPVKAALKILGLIESDELRLPLVSLEEKWLNPIREELKKTQILK